MISQGFILIHYTQLADGLHLIRCKVRGKDNTKTGGVVNYSPKFRI